MPFVWCVPDLWFAYASVLQPVGDLVMSGIVSHSATKAYRQNWGKAFDCRRCGAKAGDEHTGQKYKCLSCDRPAAPEDELQLVAEEYYENA